METSLCNMHFGDCVPNLDCDHGGLVFRNVSILLLFISIRK